MSEQKNINRIDNFELNIHKFGRISGAIILVMMIAFPFILSVSSNLFPNFSKIVSPIITLSVVLISYSIAEIIAYPPIMGAASVYMCYITGNVTNLKMPSAISTMAASGIQQGTKEGDAVSMIAVGVSTITVTVMIIISIFIIQLISPILNSPALKPAFDNVMPALIGALIGTVITSKTHVKIFILPVIICAITIRLLSLNLSIAMIISIIVSVIIARYIYIKETKGGEN